MSTPSTSPVAPIVACLLLLPATGCAGPEERLVGAWSDAEGGSLEFFEDGTCVLVHEDDRVPGTYRLLEGGRLKMDLEDQDSTRILTFANLEVSDEELAMTFEHTGDRWVLQRVDIRAKVAAREAVAEMQRAQRRTLGDIRQVGTAWFSWLTDQISAGAAGQTRTYPVGGLPKISSEELVQTLYISQTFFYINQVPEKDGWGNRYEYRYSGNPLSSRVMVIRSPGSDGEFDDADGHYTVGPFAATDYAQDIVWADGFFLRYPASSRSD